MNTARKEQIIQTAAQLFHEKGFHAVSMRDLAEKLDIKAASLYNHIFSKKEILANIVMDLAQDFTTHIQQTNKTQTSSLAKLEAIVAMHITTSLKKTDFLACMNKEWMNLETPQRKLYLKLRQEYEDTFLQIIVTGIETGEFEKRNPDILTFSLLSSLRTFYHWYTKNPQFTQKELIREMQLNLLTGIVRKK